MSPDRASSVPPDHTAPSAAPAVAASVSALGFTPDVPSGGASRRQRRRRLLAASIALISAAAVLSVVLRREPEAPEQPPAGYVVFADTAGWYKQTPNEVALQTPFDPSLDGLPGSLPRSIGPWLGDERAHDPAVDEWFRQPELVIERTYRRPDGELIWFSAFGSRSSKSYHLFEHTPDTCYPLGGWNIQSFAPRPIALADGPRPLTVNRGVARKSDGTELVFMYFYLWREPGRDPRDGVISLRLASPVRSDVASTHALLAEDFLPRLFSGTAAWRRF